MHCNGTLLVLLSAALTVLIVSFMQTTMVWPEVVVYQRQSFREQSREIKEEANRGRNG